MQEFKDLMIEKYFGLFSGIILLASLLLGMQIFSNLGFNINQHNINVGWFMVLMWSLVISIVSLIDLIKETEESEGKE